MESAYHNALGHYYQFYGDNVNAEKEYLKGASILKANAIESDGNYPQHLAALGFLYLQWPNNEHKALPIYEEAFNLIKANILTAPSKQYLMDLHKQNTALHEYAPYKNAMNKRFKEVE